MGNCPNLDKVQFFLKLHEVTGLCDHASYVAQPDHTNCYSSTVYTSP